MMEAGPSCGEGQQHSGHIFSCPGLEALRFNRNNFKHLLHECP